jgi:hypothetical protein
VFVAVLSKVPEVGRWDDLLCINHHSVLEKYCFPLIKAGLEQQNQLLCKWLPRKGTIAVLLRKYLNMSPKQYRKTLVSLTNVVETLMCAKQWDSIDFETCKKE